MTRYLAVFTGTMDGPQPDKETEEKGMAAWGKWMEDNKASIAEEGAPLGKTVKVSRDGVTETTNNLLGYIVVEAGNKEAAAKLFENHPHFTIFEGDGIEVMECLPMPGM